MPESVFTSGQASGMTRLPMGTIRRYVTQFNEHFSPCAQIATRGRRFTVKDIDLLLQIRKLYQEGFTTEAVQNALQGEWRKDSRARPGVVEAAQLVTRAQELLNDTQTIIQRTSNRLNHHDFDFESINEAIKNIQARLDQLERENQMLKYKESYSGITGWFRELFDQRIE